MDFSTGFSNYSRNNCHESPGHAACTSPQFKHALNMGGRRPLSRIAAPPSGYPPHLAFGGFSFDSPPLFNRWLKRWDQQSIPPQSFEQHPQYA